MRRSPRLSFVPANYARRTMKISRLARESEEIKPRMRPPFLGRGCVAARKLKNLQKFSQAVTFSTHRGVYVLRMPMLSPSMAMGRIVKWQVPLGTEVKAYDLLLEVSAMDLIRDTPTASEIAMDIEIMEDGTLVRLLQQEGDLVSVGQPIALLCEDSDRELHAKLLRIPTDEPSLSKYPSALWQAYVKTEGEGAAGKCS